MPKDNFAEFMGRIFTANKEFVLERWNEWEKYVADTLKADVEKAYPNGFKDFLVARLNEEIKKHTKPTKNGRRNREKGE